ncbi:MAG: cytochrome c oxidase subunit II [Thermoleophilia bacterium]|nr:cytochrome c oxidase subunit II [Thermoleophilia bacterium]
MGLSAVLGGAAFVVAYFVPWLPESGSREGGRIDDLYWLASIISLAIFVIVAAALVYAVVRFRARPGDDEDGQPIHGHTKLELVWTAIPAGLVTAIAVFSAVVLVKNEDARAGHGVIEVRAAQFAWSFTYPELGVTTGELRVRLGEQVELKLEADDVIHSFWVPEWRVKQDLVPGTTQRLLVTPTRTGTFALICTELCGLGHAVMRAHAIVLEPAEFDAWAAEQRAAVAAGGAELGSQVFANAGCGGCHALAAAGSAGAVGPDLDAALAGADPDAVRSSIVDPDATVADGYQAGVMPGNYGEQLSGEELDALVEYLVAATQG